MNKYKILESLVRKIVREEFKNSQYSRSEIEDFYDAATSSDEYDPEFEKKYNKYAKSPDVVAYLDYVKRKPNGKKLFVDYILNKRDKGNMFISDRKKFSKHGFEKSKNKYF